jgi:hypothetical protein
MQEAVWTSSEIPNDALKRDRANQVFQISVLHNVW